MRQIIRAVLLMTLGLLCLQCSNSTAPQEPDPNPPAGPERTPADLTTAEKDLLASSNEFGFELFNKITSAEPADKNIFISPLSVSFALAMTYNGAVGDTRDAMATTLRLDGMSVEEADQSYQSLTQLLTQLDPSVVFNIANSIWYRQGKAVRQEFIDACTEYFDALVKEVNFQDPATLDLINGWVDENTNGRITEILKPPVDPNIAMLLMNAIYFKGDWTNQFEDTATFDSYFYPTSESPVECRMMSKTDTMLYYQNDLFQAVDLPYGDEYFSMTVLLPQPEVTVDSLIGQLTAENWASWMTGFHAEEVPLYLPKFKFEYGIDLKEMLEAMGMAIAFDGSSADFSNMFADGVGWIDQVKHKTFVQVDESGTEAAAVTVVVMVDSVGLYMCVNRPFVFVIHEREAGTILFMGKVVNPVWED